MIEFDSEAEAARFARGFVATYLNPSLGAISKGETDQLVFRLLVEAGKLDPRGQVYDIARSLNVTPAKARNLLFQWQLRAMSRPSEMRQEIARAISNVRFATDGTYLAFGVESPLVREELRSRFKKLGVFADASFSAEIVRVSVRHFVDFMDDFFDDKSKSDLHAALVRDRQVKDTSFKAVAYRVINGLAEKALGKAGNAIVDGAADALGPFIKALFLGDTKQARDQSDLVLV